MHREFMRISATITLSVRKSDIPEYLRQGQFYRSLIENDESPDEDLTFPVGVLKPDVTVRCVDDCDHLLNSLRFWGVVEFISEELVDFVLSVGSATVEVLQNYEAELGYLRPLRLMTVATDRARMEIAIKSGIIELLKCAVRRSNMLPSNACDLAAAAGNVEVIKYLQSHGCSFTNGTLHTAAKSGHCTILKYLHEHGRTIEMKDLRVAAEGGHLDCVKYMFPLLNASNDLCVVRTLVRTSVDTASINGHMSILRYLDSCQIDWSRHSCIDAAEAGNLECLKFLHEHGCKRNVGACMFAALNGHLDCLQYLHEHGCPWNEYTCFNAATHGHLNCLQYAYERGCPTGILADVALTNGNPCKAYLALHGF